jgi:ribosomal protein S10
MKLRIKLSSADAGAVDKTITDIIDLVGGKSVTGPIPLPTRDLKFKDNALKHVVHARLMDIEVDAEMLIKLQDLNIPVCVSVDMKG